MLEYLQQLLPLDVLQLLAVCAASFLIGLGMEGRKAEGAKPFSPGGVRTFPLICLAGFLLAKLGLALGGGGWPALIPFVAGLAVLGLLVALLYRAKIAAGNYGMTTEVFALAAYVLGGLVAANLWWLAAAQTVLMILLQELKAPLERLVGRVGGDELVTIAKFVLLTAVILPLMPDRPMTRFGLNPQTIWLIVVAVAAVSYASYLLARGLGERRSAYGPLLTGLLGGGYSSTVTTVVVARRARGAGRGAAAPTGCAILAASGMMRFRLLALLAIFDLPLATSVFWPLATVGLAAIVAAGALALARRDETSAGAGAASTARTSPLELRTALTFAAVFVLVVVLTRLAQQFVGPGGVYTVAAVSGLGVVDPFVLSLTTGPAAGGVGAAALAVIVAASANDLAKGFYALWLARRPAGTLALGLLAVLALATVGAWWAFARIGLAGAP